MDLHTWLLYTLAVIGLAITPGPNGLLALTHGALYGSGKAVYTVAGGVLGFTCLIALSMFGLGALIQTSSDTLMILKWVGAAYLLWLGIQLWRAPVLQLGIEGEHSLVPNHSLFRKGLLTALSNPKVLVFYAAFLPQFLEPERPMVSQFAIMAITYAVIEFLVEYQVAKFAHFFRPWLQRAGKGFNRSCGSLFALVGVALPLMR
ncbi:LysE family translocator [Marinobacterium mangrovicola]|uniref:Threonine/homoserine/homoserine lactone efflux protein n=1 Tax=Marinobacterium mangrovicola TaxID=1476959 RepID=A0A4R1GXV2_9GAMM|nr:LysE family translocator [Marinobacterium mangrovicola]TCK09282.1 threonine/homoserine/homoserine lactone efflux protein [Marinobacterium mangrovicola]